MFTQSAIIQPQYVASGSAAAMTLVVSPSGSTATSVPALTVLSLYTCRFTNATTSPVALTVYRVPSGGSAGAATVVVNQITVPAPSLNQPYFDWSPNYQLAHGDAIWALAGTASAIVVTGDGGITQ